MLRMMEKPVDVTPAQRTLTGPTERTKSHSFELGEACYGAAEIAYVLTPDNTDLFDNARKIIRNFKYSSVAMEREVSRYLPRLMQSFDDPGGNRVLLLQKTPDVFMLRDVVSAKGGRLDPRHVAWIISATYNIACYLEWAGIVHSDISMDTVFISPEKHRAMLYGGWWYALPAGEKIVAMNRRTASVAPATVRPGVSFDSRIDHTLIGLLGLELLGSPSPRKKSAAPLPGLDEMSARFSALELGDDAPLIPQPMLDFLREPPGSTAIENYTAWKNTVLPAAFGKPRFVKLDVSASEIFRE